MLELDWTSIQFYKSIFKDLSNVFTGFETVFAICLTHFREIFLYYLRTVCVLLCSIIGTFLIHCYLKHYMLDVFPHTLSTASLGNNLKSKETVSANAFKWVCIMGFETYIDMIWWFVTLLRSTKNTKNEHRFYTIILFKIISYLFIGVLTRFHVFSQKKWHILTTPPLTPPSIKLHSTLQELMQLW